ncbi:MAG: DUF167 domain-containing protein [Acidobacteriota bacterium]|nr:DUF167 domain-containing protein [Acidobacteriota bacterium]
MFRISLKVKAGARKTEFGGRFGDAWKLSVAAPPVYGKANEEIIRFLAKLARVPARNVRIVTGHTSPAKIVEIQGAGPDAIQRVMLETNGSPSHSGSPAARKP